jgi:hypothetical protein
MSHGIDTAVDDMERTTTDSAFDHVRGHPEALQLPSCDNPVLATRQRGHLRVELGRCGRPKSTRVFHDTDAGKEMRVCGTHFVPT